MPRLSFPDPDTMTREQREVHDRIVAGPRGRVVGPLRAALHSPELAERWQALGALLRYGTTLDARCSELAILVTGRACHSPLEWHVHRQEAEKAGVSAEVIDALLAQQAPTGLNEEEAAVVDYARELNAYRSVSDATHQRVVACLGERGAVELTALIGYYTMVAMTLNCHEIPLPDNATPAFPMPQQLAPLQ